MGFISNSAQNIWPVSRSRVPTDRLFRDKSQLTKLTLFEPVTNAERVFSYFLVEYETYKSQMRPRITQFISAMQKHGFEWLLVYVPLGTRGSKDLNKSRKVYKKVMDKLRSDYDLGTLDMIHGKCK